jgi:hypothetical protein
VQCQFGLPLGLRIDKLSPFPYNIDKEVIP